MDKMKSEGSPINCSWDKTNEGFYFFENLQYSLHYVVKQWVFGWERCVSRFC